MTLLAVLALLAAPPIAPLVAGYPTAQGDASVSFQLGQQPTVGLAYFLQNDVAVRLDLGFAIQPGTDEFSADLGVRFYKWKHDRVGIFFQPSVGFGRVAAGGGTEFLRFGAGFGVEYFFTDHLSAGGLLGVLLQLGNLGGAGSTQTTFSTATSGLFLNVYF